MADDFFDDDFEDLPDFFIGVGIGLIEEELEEERRIKRKLERENDPIHNPDDEEPYP